MSLANILLGVYMTMAPVDDTTAVDTSSVSKPFFEVQMLYLDNKTGKLDTIAPILPDVTTLDGKFEYLTGKLQDDIVSMGSIMADPSYRFTEHNGSVYLFKTSDINTKNALTTVMKYNLQTHNFGELHLSENGAFYTTKPDTLKFSMSKDEESVKALKEAFVNLYEKGPFFSVYTDGFVGELERSEGNPPNYE